MDTSILAAALGLSAARTTRIPPWSRARKRPLDPPSHTAVDMYTSHGISDMRPAYSFTYDQLVPASCPIDSSVLAAAIRSGDENWSKRHTPAPPAPKIAKRQRVHAPEHVEPVPAVEVELMPPNEFGVQLVKPYAMYAYQVRTVTWMIQCAQERHPMWRHERNNATEDGRPQQRECRGGLLAMFMGLGKSLTSGTFVCHMIEEQRASKTSSLFVCPKTLLGTMRHELHKFFGNQMSVAIYHPNYLRSRFHSFDRREARKYDVIITTYETLRRPTIRGTRWFTVIFDESHELRQRECIRTQIARSLRARHKFCMTGTPIHNHVRDIFSQLEVTGMQWPTETRLISEHGLSELELWNRMRFVQLADAVSVNLPPKVVHRVTFELSVTERVLHDHFWTRARLIFEEAQRRKERAQEAMEAQRESMAEERRMRRKQAKEACPTEKERKEEDEGKEPSIISNHNTDGAAPTAPLVSEHKENVLFVIERCITRCSQICSAAHLLTPASKRRRVKIDAATVEATLPEEIAFANEWIQDREGGAGIRSSKMLAFVDLLQRIRREEPGKKVVVFACFSSTLYLAVEAVTATSPDFVHRHVIVTGNTVCSDKRDRQFDLFRGSATVNTLFMTLKLGSVGLNLTEASCVIFLEPWYSYSAMEQGEGRVHRIGQTAPQVDVYYILAKDSGEESVYDIAQGKREVAERVRADHRKQSLRTDARNIADAMVEHDGDANDTIEQEPRSFSDSAKLDMKRIQQLLYKKGITPEAQPPTSDTQS